MRSASLQASIPRSTVHRLIRTQLRFKLYRPKQVQKLNHGDNAKRVDYCQWLLDADRNDPSPIDRIFWTNEATFKLSGMPHRYNTYFWSEENPHILMEKPLNTPGITVFAGMWSHGIVGPYFHYDYVNGESYLRMLTEEVVLCLQNHPVHDNMIWMQDGAPAHFSTIVRQYLHKTFDNWIGRSGKISWPQRSPDMTPCDFSMWGTIKTKVFERQPQTDYKLKTYIVESFNDLRNDIAVCKKTVRSTLARATKCIQQNGSHFEHLL